MNISKCPKEQGSAKSWWDRRGHWKEPDWAPGGLGTQQPPSSPRRPPTPAPASLAAASQLCIGSSAACKQGGMKDELLAQLPQAMTPSRCIQPAAAPRFSSSNDSAPLTHQVQPGAGDLAPLLIFFLAGRVILFATDNVTS